MKMRDDGSREQPLNQLENRLVCVPIRFSISHFTLPSLDAHALFSSRVVFSIERVSLNSAQTRVLGGTRFSSQRCSLFSFTLEILRTREKRIGKRETRLESSRSTRVDELASPEGWTLLPVCSRKSLLSSPSC